MQKQEGKEIERKGQVIPVLERRLQTAERTLRRLRGQLSDANARHDLVTCRRSNQQPVDDRHAHNHYGLPYLDLLLRPEEQRKLEQEEIHGKIRRHLLPLEIEVWQQVGPPRTLHLFIPHDAHDLCTFVFAEVAHVLAYDCNVLPLRRNHL